MKTKRILAVLAALIFFSTYPRAALAIDFSALGGVTMSDATSLETITGGSGHSMATSYGFGGLIGYDFAPMFGIETGVFFLQHDTQITNFAAVGVAATFTAKNLSVPVMLRFSPVPFLAFEAGGYFVFDSLVETRSAGVLLSSAKATTQDNGLIGGITFMMPLAPTLSLRVSAYYEYGLTDLSGNGSKVFSRNIDVLGGLRISI